MLVVVGLCGRDCAARAQAGQQPGGHRRGPGGVYCCCIEAGVGWQACAEVFTLNCMCWVRCTQVAAMFGAPRGHKTQDRCCTGAVPGTWPPSRAALRGHAYPSAKTPPFGSKVGTTGSPLHVCLVLA